MMEEPRRPADDDKDDRGGGEQQPAKRPHTTTTRSPAVSAPSLLQIHRYHALGNDYIVVTPDAAKQAHSSASHGGWRPHLQPSSERDGLVEGLGAAVIQRICHRHFGAGSDGILFGPLPSPRGCDYRLRIYNPDGSEAEKSGNGLRIFSRYLYDAGLVHGDQVFTVETLGGDVHCRVFSGGHRVSVNMGRVSFRPRDIPFVPEMYHKREAVHASMDTPSEDEEGEASRSSRDPEIQDAVGLPLTLGQSTASFCGVTVGNPHCVVLLPPPSKAHEAPGNDSSCKQQLDLEVSKETAIKYGPELEHSPMFPNKTNVQFVEVVDRSNIRIEIWERGAGYTLASGSSSTACAAAAVKLGLCDPQLIHVHMPGGCIDISFTSHHSSKAESSADSEKEQTTLTATMTGSVTRVFTASLSHDIMQFSAPL